MRAWVLHGTDGSTRARKGARERRNAEQRLPLLPISDQQHNSPRRSHATRRAPKQITGDFTRGDRRDFRQTRIVQSEQLEHRGRGEHERVGVRRDRLEILRDLRMRLFPAIVRAAFGTLRGSRFLMTLRAVRAVAVIAHDGDGGARAEAEESASDAKKLRAHDRQHAEREEQLFEM